VTLGGYKERDPVPTADQLAKLVEEGELHYVLIGDDTGGSGSYDATSSSNGVLAGVRDWVVANGTPVGANEYGAASGAGTLYYLP
jgi:hypothetical protein